MSEQPTNSDEKLGIGLKIVSFIFPLVGAILYFVYKSKSPGKAKGACTAALWGLAFGVIVNIIMKVAAG